MSRKLSISNSLGAAAISLDLSSTATCPNAKRRSSAQALTKRSGDCPLQKGLQQIPFGVAVEFHIYAEPARATTRGLTAADHGA